MSYHPDRVVNDFMLTIINDGDGVQCGMTYRERCAAADTGIFQFRAACRAYNRYRRQHYGTPHADRLQILEAATRLQEYYRAHVAEGARD